MRLDIRYRLRRLLAQLVPLDLASHGFRQLGYELDQVRVLKTLEPRLAVLLELRHQLVARHGVLRDHEGLDAREAIDSHAENGALRDRGVLDERCLDLDRRDPQAADLDHVVGPALVPVEAVIVDAVAVAAEEPLPED